MLGKRWKGPSRLLWALCNDTYGLYSISILWKSTRDASCVCSVGTLYSGGSCQAHWKSVYSLPRTEISQRSFQAPRSLSITTWNLGWGPRLESASMFLSVNTKEGTPGDSHSWTQTSGNTPIMSQHSQCQLRQGGKPASYP